MVAVPSRATVPAPLLLIVGYLGAGKTTLLQRLVPLLGAAGTRPHVILNDYQDARVDAARLAALDALVTPISGDCICCGSREELLTSLAALPLTGDSLVLIEANGTSDATELHDILALDPRLDALTRPMQVTVVDARRWQRRWFDKRLEREQAVTASHLWVNWGEALDAGRRTEVEASLREVNAQALHVTPEQLAADLIALRRSPADAPPRRLGGTEQPRFHTHDTTRHHFASVGLELPAVVDRAALEALIRELTPRVRRAKGVVAFSDAPGRQFAWSYVEGDDALRVEALPDGGFATVAVFIGADLGDTDIATRVRQLAIQ